MKILVAVKRVIDYAVHIRIKPDASGVETSNVKMAMNPFDEIAVEEAIRIKEQLATQNITAEIIAVSIGTTPCQEILRTALAMGADRAVLVETTTDIQPLAAAKILKKIAEQESPQLILLGKQAIDSDNNQVGQMLAGLLSWPQGTFASKIKVESEWVTVTREIDGGLETVQLKLPAVITTDLRLNEPRYLSLPNIVQAKRKPITVLPATELNIDIQPRIQIIKVTAPEKRRTGVKVASVQELVDKLRHEAQVIA